jgi:hypothetical protein
MLSEKPVFDHGEARRPSTSGPSQAANGSSPRQRVARQIAAVNDDLLARIIRMSELRERTQARLSATTEVIALSQEALARSRDLLAGCRREQDNTANLVRADQK